MRPQNTITTEQPQRPSNSRVPRWLSKTQRALRSLGVLTVLGIAGLILDVSLLAHGGFDHVIGTVLKVENNVLTVKTTKGNADVRLNDQTEITKGDHKAQISDLQPGTRIVVDVPEGSKERIAHSVKVGVGKTTAAQAHPARK